MRTRLLFLLLLCSCGSTTLSPVSKEEQGNILTLMTYNVGAFSKPGYDTMSQVSVFLKSSDPDALVLNELDSCNTRSGVNNYQMEKIAGIMGDWPFEFAGAIAYKGGSYGNGAMVNPRHHVIDKWTAKLPKSDGREVRSLVVIETDSFVYCGTHLDLTDASQLDQVEAINALISKKYKDYKKPVFLCGDMNAEPGSATIAKLQQNWTLLSSTANSFSSSNPVKCIDYILSYKDAAQVKIVSAKIVTVKNLSDHFPQRVIVRLD